MPAYKSVPGADQFYPLNEPVIGTAYPESVYPQNSQLPILFQPLTIKGVTFKNRIFVSPMCQYSSKKGYATDWHLVHVGGFATRGAGAICMEATSVVPEGRISPEDAGLWEDGQIEPLKRIVNFSHAQGTLIGVQLSHAGRKASTQSLWVHSSLGHGHSWIASEEQDGWPDNVWGPSTLEFSETYPHPKEMDEAHIQYVEDWWVKSVERCKQAGFDFIEIHGAHGYLLHSFVSPLSNVRTDQYGGQSLENRLRFPLRLISRIRAAWDKPLFVRLSATDWAVGPEKGEDGLWKQWGIEQTKVFVDELKKIGIDLIDCSSGGNWVDQQIPVGPSYQVPFAHELKKAYPDLLVGAVGQITEPEQAEGILKDGKADVIFLARELIRDPHWPLVAASKLGVVIKPANQYERGWSTLLNSAVSSKK
ncbi:hypothetical protein C8Q72DRAFT_886021 [Fomitopsis betulina]|nr:hypothetical protein C8Q72DRAFT_886021 [Fomitopsis betulina]